MNSELKPYEWTIIHDNRDKYYFGDWTAVMEVAGGCIVRYSLLRAGNGITCATTSVFIPGERLSNFVGSREAK